MPLIAIDAEIAEMMFGHDCGQRHVGGLAQFDYLRDYLSVVRLAKSARLSHCDEQCLKACAR